MMTKKRFIVIDVPYENGEPFLYKKMLDKTTKKEYDNTLKGIDDMCDLANKLHKENEQLKQQLFETSKELLWATSDEVDRALYFKEEVEELRKEIFG